MSSVCERERETERKSVKIDSKREGEKERWRDRETRGGRDSVEPRFGFEFARDRISSMSETTAPVDIGTLIAPSPGIKGGNPRRRRCLA